MENLLTLKKNCSYLIKRGITINSITILLVTDKAYHIKWNTGLDSTNTWELKEYIDDYYSFVEDITAQLSVNNIKYIDEESKSEILSKVGLKLCHVCKGFGTIPNSNSTSGRTTCPLCFGSKMISDKIEIES